MKQDLPQPTGGLLTTRRKLMQYATLLGVGSTSLLQSRDLKAAIVDGKEAAGLNNPWPQMQYRKLGRTGHNSSRLIFLSLIHI